MSFQVETYRVDERRKQGDKANEGSLCPVTMSCITVPDLIGPNPILRSMSVTQVFT